MKGIYIFGAKPLKKNIEPGGEPYLPAAMNKLRDLYRNPAPYLLANMLVGDASIHVEKTIAFDRITIRAEGGPWVAVADDGIFNTVYSRFAYGRPSKWKEPIIKGTLGFGSLVIDLPNNKDTWDIHTFADKMAVQSKPPIWSLGDAKRWGFALDYDSWTSGGAHSFPGEGINIRGRTVNESFLVRIAENPPNLGDGRRLGQNLYVGTSRILQRYDTHGWAVQPMYGPNPDIVPEGQPAPITLQFAVLGNRGNVVSHGEGIEPTWIQAAFMRIDVDKGAWKQIGTNVFQHVVDVELGPGPSIMHLCMLTPLRMIAMGLYDRPLAIPAIGLGQTQRLFSTMDGGYNWTRHDEAMVSTNMAVRNTTQVAALDGSTMLRCGPVVTAQHDVGDPSDPVTIIDEVTWCVQRVGIDGSVSNLLTVYVEEHDTESAEFTVSLNIFALGKNTFLLEQRTQEAIDAGYTHTVSAGVEVEVFYARQHVYLRRSFNGGEDWTDPEEETAFEATADPILSDRNGFNVDTVSRAGGGFADIPPRLVRKVLYPYIATNDPAGSLIYTTVWKVRYDGAYQGISGQASDSYVYQSKDMGRTWKEVSEVSQRAQQGALDAAKFGYFRIIDSSAPIDPIFPWRVDARQTPPDWW